MDNFLIFFVLPVATILLAIVLQKVLNNPILVGITFFAIYLIVTYTAFDSSFLIFAIIYTLIAYITAVLTCLICNLINRLGSSNECIHSCICSNSNSNNEITTQLISNDSIYTDSTDSSEANGKIVNNNCYRYKNYRR